MALNWSAMCLAALDSLGRRREVEDPGDFAGEHYVYVVYNGADVLTAGQGSNPQRLQSILRGGNAGRHNKAFICAIGETVLGSPNRAAYIMLAPSDKEKSERLLHDSLDVSTNVQCASRIVGISETSVIGVHEGLWTRMRGHRNYLALDPVERRMAEELFHTVTYSIAWTKSESSENVRRSAQGDILEEYVLTRTGKAYLIEIFRCVTDGYLKYSSQRPAAAEWARIKREYVIESPYPVNVLGAGANAPPLTWKPPRSRKRG